MMFGCLLGPDFLPLLDVLGGASLGLNIEEDWDADDGTDTPVLEQPAVLPVKPVRKLANLGGESIRILHRPVGLPLHFRN